MITMQSSETSRDADGSLRRGSLRGKSGGEPTRLVRVPVSMADEILDFVARGEIPLFEDRVAAGFPSPAEGVTTGGLDVVSLLMPHPENAFLYRFDGVGLEELGIFPGDLLVVWTQLSPVPGAIVLLINDGEFIVRRLETRNAPSIPQTSRRLPQKRSAGLSDSASAKFCGVVRYVIHQP